MGVEIMAMITVKTQEEELKEVAIKQIKEDYKKISKSKDTIEQRIALIEKILGLE